MFISEASFASSLLCETPTEAVSPVRWRMRLLISRAISSALPKRPMLPVTSRKASSSEKPFDEVRELPENLEHLLGDLAIALHARAHDDRVRAALQRLAHRHRGMHAEPALTS